MDYESKDLVECAWCGAEIEAADRIYRRREEAREAYCSRAHRDAAQAAVRALRDQWEEMRSAGDDR
jgi:hypothetical protein